MFPQECIRKCVLRSVRSSCERLLCFARQSGNSISPQLPTLVRQRPDAVTSRFLTLTQMSENPRDASSPHEPHAGIVSAQSDAGCIRWCVCVWGVRTPPCLELPVFMSERPVEHTHARTFFSHAKNVPELGGLSFVFLGIHTF